jgi:hypothetical protein
MFNLKSQHGNCHGSFITCKGCFHWAFLVHIFPVVIVASIHRKVIQCQPTASNQALHLLKIFLHKQHSAHLEILGISLLLLHFFNNGVMIN